MKRTCFLVAAVILFLASSAACGGGGEPSSREGVGAAPERATPAGTERDAGAGDGHGSACAAGEAACVGWNRRSVCRDGARVVETCASGAGCLRGACTPARCADECTLGTTASGKTCAGWDMIEDAWTEPDAKGSLHDRARAYLEWLQRDGLGFGGVGDATFGDPGTYASRIRLDGTGDSALWTGTYLAAESLRLLATGASDARAHVRALVDTLHLWWNVSPSPGVLARFVRPAGAASPEVEIDCSRSTHHCGAPYAGKAYDYNGHVSRDQYQGVMLGYALAYDALGTEDEPRRAKIRQDVLTLLDELMKEREIDVMVTYKGTTYPKFRAKTRFMVIVEEELDQGAITLAYDGDIGAWRGFQEFIPDLADLFGQIPLLGLAAPQSIPRDGSAIMLASFFRVALRVTEDVPALAAKRSTIEAFYLGNKGRGGNVFDWIPIANQWTVGGDACGKGYYANNITMQPMYNWARLEQTAAVTASARAIVKDKMWPGFASHKNTFFTFLSAANMASPDPAAIAGARDQLAQLPEPPLVRRPVDLRSDPRFAAREPGCTDKASRTAAVDVGERPYDGFVWQRDPWSLHDDGDLAKTFPGVDYLVAYFLGLRHGFVEDDAAGRCLRWR